MKEATGVTIIFKGMLLIDTDLLIQGRVKVLNLEIQRRRPWDIVPVRRGSASADSGSLHLSSTSNNGERKRVVQPGKWD